MDEQKIDELREMVKEELEDVDAYMKLYEEAPDHGKCIFKDIARDELSHAKHLCFILEKHGNEVEDLKEMIQETRNKYVDY